MSNTEDHRDEELREEEIQEEERNDEEVQGGSPDDEPIDSTESKLRRAMADLANVRKRQVKDLADARARAIESFTHELLPVVDNFHLALGASEQSQTDFDPAMIVEGMKMVRSMLEDVLQRHGLAEITAEGQTFDPNQHEAVGVDTDTEVAPGTITKVVQRGYTMNGKVVRASRVMVRGEVEG